MKTIVHLTLSDLDRRHLGEVWYARKAPVTRGEVTQEVQHYIQRELTTWRRNNEQPDTVRDDDRDGAGRVRVDNRKDEGPERCASNDDVDGESADEKLSGSPSYLTVPTAAGLTTACKRVLEHIRENEADQTLSLGYCASILLATGIE